MTDVTHALAEWVVTLRPEDLPTDVVDAAVDALLDCVGVALGGSASPTGAILREHAAIDATSGGPAATVLGAPFRAPIEMAVLVNGVAAHALDFDDTWSPVAGVAQATASHPSCTVVPVVLALGEQLHATGREVLTAYVAGMEVHGKLGFPGRTTVRTGFHGSAVFGALGAAAAAASLLQLDTSMTAAAFGCAAVHAAGLNANRGTMTKPYQVGAAAAGGVRAARLASRGFTASEVVLDQEDGFLQFVDAEEWDPDRIVPSLGAPFSLIDPGIDMKRHASCFFTHRPIDATLEMVGRHDLAPEEVESVDVVAPARSIVNRPEPRTALDAKFSLQFTVAEAVLRHRVPADSFDDSRLATEAVRSMMARVHVHEDPTLDSDYPLVERPVRIARKDGRVLEDPVEAGVERWVLPMARHELIAKYLDLAVPIVGEAVANNGLCQLLALERAQDVATLAPTFRPVEA